MSSNGEKGEATPLVDKPGNGIMALGHQAASVLALMALISIAVTKVQLTSVLFSAMHYPTAYSLYSCIVTDLMLVPLFLIFPNQWGIPKREMFAGPHYAFTLIIIFTTCDLAFTNIALDRLAVPLQQCIAATNPFWTLLIEGIIHRKTAHPVIYLAIVGLVAGAILSVVSDLSSVDMLGVLAQICAVLCSASKAAFTHAAFKQFKGVLGPLSLLFWVDLLMIPIFVPWVLIDGELIDLLKSNMSAGDWWRFSGTAALGGVRAMTQFFVLSLMTATSGSVANIFTLALNIIISFIVPWAVRVPTVTPMLVIGLTLTLTFSALYTYLKSGKDACFGIMLPKPPPEGTEA